MEILSKTGRIFYSIAMLGIGLVALYYHYLPYMLLPPMHLGPTVLLILAYFFGGVFFLAGAAMLFQIRTGLISFLFGGLILLIVCLWYIPYEVATHFHFKDFGEWENAEKDLSLSGGALVIAGYFAGKNETVIRNFLPKLIRIGAVFFAIPIICFGTYHFLYPNDVSTMVPLWIPQPIFWTYFAGTALIGSGIAIIFKIRHGVFAALLGLMIFIWFMSIHLPAIFTSPHAYLKGEITSACLALAYSGAAFVIAGTFSRAGSLRASSWAGHGDDSGRFR